MKKILLSLGLAVTVLGTATAQDGPTDHDQVTLNVKLYPIQTLEVNTGQKTVDLEYKTVTNYAEGVESTNQDHLKVYSTGGFAVKVKSEDAALKRANGDQKIAANGISVSAAVGTTNPLATATVKSVSLSTAEKTLIASRTGGVDKTFDITYKGAGADTYVNKYFNDENPTVYTTTVTYSIEAL